MLSRSVPGSDSAEIGFELARAVSAEIYTVLIAEGPELRRNSHSSMTGLCQCTREPMAICAFDVARIRLKILHGPLDQEHKGE